MRRQAARAGAAAGEKDMLEHITRALYYVHVHLLYASMVWVAAWFLTSIPRGSATTKYWIWVATSINFILPVGAVIDKLGASHLSWAAPLGFMGEAANSIAQSSVAGALFVVWLLGALLMFRRVVLRIRAERRDARTTAGESAMDRRPGFLAHGVPVRFVGSHQAPAVDGILRPHISLPHGIDTLLSDQEFDAILVHEVTHARRRDNLIRLIHEMGLCALWFHPFVWITGSRIALYRELSCDESVIQQAQGEDLVSALAKLANPQEGFLLQSTASSFMSHRLARLTAAQPARTRATANALLTALFVGVLLGCVYATVSHTACCFLAQK